MVRIALGWVLMGGTGWAAGQIPGPVCGPKAWQTPCTVAPAASPKKTDAAKPEPKGADQQFPFPGDAAAAPPAALPTKDQFPYPGDKPAAPKDGGAAAGAFPYPGETKSSPDAVPETPEFKPFEGDDRMPPKGGAAPVNPAGSSSSSSSSGGDPAADADDKPGLKDEGSEGDTHTSRRRRLRPPAQKTLSDEERADEDLTVAHFYTQTGNFTGAYMRAKDAVKLTPNESEAHFALAEAAEKSGKKDEAVEEYKAYLKMDPDGEHAKVVQRALVRLK